MNAPVALIALIVAFWIVDNASAYYYSYSAPIARRVSKDSFSQTMSYPATICFSNAWNSIGNPSGSTGSPFDEDAIRFAYDEWRLMYGKGEFDRYRFENFKTNYKTLTMANLQARDKPVQNGQRAQWMSLNEYGDYSVAEYEAMLEGRLIGKSKSINNHNKATFVTPGPATVTQMNQSNNSNPYQYQYSNGIVGGEEQQDQYGRPIRPTQVVASALSSRGTQVIQSDNNYQTPAYRLQQADQQSFYDASIIYSNRYGNGGEEFQDQFGRTIRPTQVLKSVTPMGQSYGASTNIGTQVIQGRSTESQIISSPTTTGSETIISRGTQVIQSTDNSSDARATHVIQSSTTYSDSSLYGGTQDMNANDSPVSSTYGTQVVRSFHIDDSSLSKSMIVNGSDDKDATLKGTRVITNPAGTVVVADTGTLVIGKGGQETGNQNTTDLPGDSNANEESRNTVGQRGTMVIKRQIPQPELLPKSFNFLNFRSEEQRETVVIDNIASKDKETATNKPAKNNLFNLFGGLQNDSDDDETKKTSLTQEVETKENESPFIFSLFGGQRKANDWRSVRGTIVIQNIGKKKTEQLEGKRRKTVLIPKKSTPNGLPSILSFFGGAKKVTEDDPAQNNVNARPTLLIKKPTKEPWILFSSSKKSKETVKLGDQKPTTKTSKSNQENQLDALLAGQKQAIENVTKKNIQLLKQMEEKQKELQEKRRKATERRVSRAQERFQFKGPNSPQSQQRKPLITALGQPIMSRPSAPQRKKTSPAIINPRLSFFSFNQVPEVRRWKQNFDGSITGLIYNSNSFEDGTRVTTSPVPRDAKKGTTVTTSGGTKYFLQ